MARADIHVFGSKSGYCTIAASPGLRPDEVRELEHFQFGELSTSEAIANLESRPTMTSRALASGRIALSRMLPAGVDDAGRPTLEVVTLVIDVKAYEASIGALELLAESAARWRDARQQTRTAVALPSGVAPSADPRDPALLRILDAWMFATRSGSVAVLPESATQDLLRFVATLDPSDRRRCRWGIGINSLSAPVDVCTMMQGASTHGARSVVRPAPVGQWHARETEFAQSRASSGGNAWVPTSQMIPPASAVGMSDQAEHASANTRPGLQNWISAHAAESAAAVGARGREQRIVLGSMIAAAFSTLLLATGAFLYIGDTPARRGGVGSAVGGTDAASSSEATVLPPLGSSNRSGFGSAIPPNSDETSPAPKSASGTTRVDGSSVQEPASTSTVAAPSSPAPEPANALVASPPARRVTIQLYPDADGDALGVEEGKISIQEGDPWPEGSWAEIGGDECPHNKARGKPGRCGCIDVSIESIDRDVDGNPDCTQDDDCDGILNYEDPAWNPQSELRVVLFKLQSSRESLVQSIDLLDQINPEPQQQGESLDAYLHRVCSAVEGVAENLRSVFEDLQRLHKEQVDALKKGEGFPFARRMLPDGRRDERPNCLVIDAWTEIVERLQSIAKRTSSIREKLEFQALGKAKPGNNQKRDFTTGDAKERVARAWATFERKLGPFERFIDGEKLSAELDALQSLSGKERRDKNTDGKP